ncbi:MFS transporter [Paeniglutamicibacter cryotolerans]|uniref:MFS family permease n=1 Tax=Paeniglutamicibacter cryotolerans TaxID=670079 RepID=A0A839QL39_9MICC|nr:MFS transporter [Paeniglutamicibacter cryotolerans]MBB2996929.1 MFS family permease [Paeniglutamicibacter cryotolerans]
MPKSPAETPPTPVRPGLIIAVLAFVGIAVSLMQTIMIPLIPQLPTLLDTSRANSAWVITATLLAGAIVTPISGRLGDIFGKRLMLMISLGALVIGSILCAVTVGLLPMLIGRALQGLAMGAIPLGISLLRDVLPRERMGSAVATMSATMGVGGAVGLPLAALIAQHADWHMLFWASAALGIICLALVAAVLRESAPGSRASFDGWGAFGLSLGLVAFLLPITKGADWGWTSPLTLGLFAAAVLILACWGIFEWRTTAPLVNLRVSIRPSVLFTNMASIAVGFAMYGMNLAFPQLLMAPDSTGYGMGLGMVQAGLVLAPGGVVMMLLSPVSAKITAARGPKTTLLTGSAVVALGYVLALIWNQEIWHITLASMVICGGIGLAYAAMPALIMGSVPLSDTAAANGLNALMRSVGTSVSAAVMGVVLAQMTLNLGPVTVPSLAGFQMTFMISISAAALAMVLTAFIPRHGHLERVNAPAPTKVSVSA